MQEAKKKNSADGKGGNTSDPQANESWGQTWRKLLNRRENAQNLRMPNLIGVGAARCGTTSLFSTFRKTEGIFTPDVKELTYFSRKHREANARGWFKEDYMLFFDEWADEPLAAEVSPQYLHDPEVPRRILEESPEAKIVIQFRDPVERMVSHFNKHAQYHGYADVNEYADIAIASFEAGKRHKKFSHPSTNFYQSFYADGAQRYLDAFGQDRICMIHLNHYNDDSAATSNMLSEFTGVEVSINAKMRANSSDKVAGVDALNSTLSQDRFSKLNNIFSQDYSRVLDLYREIRFTPLRYGASVIE